MKGLFFLIVLMATQCVNAQTILDRSQKKRPEWYGRTMTDYMVVSATDKDLETAKQIVEYVALFVYVVARYYKK